MYHRRSALGYRRCSHYERCLGVSPARAHGLSKANTNRTPAPPPCLIDGNLRQVVRACWSKFDASPRATNHGRWARGTLKAISWLLCMAALDEAKPTLALAPGPPARPLNTGATNRVVQSYVLAQDSERGLWCLSERNEVRALRACREAPP